MKAHLIARLLAYLCQTPPMAADAPQAQNSLIFGNWGCAIIIFFFIVIAVLNAIGDLFG